MIEVACRSMTVPSSAVRDHERADLEHRFGGFLLPENAVAFQPQVDHAANAASRRRYRHRPDGLLLVLFQSFPISLGRT